MRQAWHHKPNPTPTTHNPHTTPACLPAPGGGAADARRCAGCGRQAARGCCWRRARGGCCQGGADSKGACARVLCKLCAGCSLAACKACSRAEFAARLHSCKPCNPPGCSRNCITRPPCRTHSAWVHVPPPPGHAHDTHCSAPHHQCITRVHACVRAHGTHTPGGTAGPRCWRDNHNREPAGRRGNGRHHAAGCHGRARAGTGARGGDAQARCCRGGTGAAAAGAGGGRQAGGGRR